MKKPNKNVQKFLKDLRIDSVMESCKTALKIWRKRTNKFLKQREPLFDQSVSHTASIELRKDLCEAVTSYIYDGNQVIKDLQAAKNHFGDARKRLAQMNYQELRDVGLDRLYANDAMNFIKVQMKKIDGFIESMNREQMNFVTSALVMLNRNPPISDDLFSFNRYKVLIGFGAKNEMSISWFSNGDKKTSTCEATVQKQSGVTNDDLLKVISPAVSKINAIDDMVKFQMNNNSMKQLINATEKHTKEISRLSEAVEKLETSEPEKVHYEKPVVGKSPEEVTEKKPFSVTSENR